MDVKTAFSEIQRVVRDYFENLHFEAGKGSSERWLGVKAPTIQA